MQNLQIKFLYEQYGWSIDQISALLNLSPCVVRLTIEEEHLEQKQVKKTQEDTQQDIETLKSDEVIKQQHLMPLMTVIELSLFAKVMEAVNECNTPSDIVHMIKAYKLLTQDAIVNAVIREEKSSGRGPAIAVQIINEVA